MYQYITACRSIQIAASVGMLPCRVAQTLQSWGISSSGNSGTCAEESMLVERLVYLRAGIWSRGQSVLEDNGRKKKLSSVRTWVMSREEKVEIPSGEKGRNWLWRLGVPWYLNARDHRRGGGCQTTLGSS